MATWTKAMAVMVAVWATAMTAATQNGPASRSGGPLKGRVVSASGATVVGGPSTDSGHPVAGARVHLIPVTAIDTTSRMTASSIYAAPFPAEAFDEPLEDTIRLRGDGFPQATTDAQGNFSIAHVPDGKFFVHVTPGQADAEHLPGGSLSRRQCSRRAAARPGADDRAVEPPVRCRQVHRKLCLPDVPQGSAALGADRSQAGMDRAGRARAPAGLFATPGVRHAA